VHRVTLSRGAPFEVTPPVDRPEIIRRREMALAHRNAVTRELARAHDDARQPKNVTETRELLAAGAALILMPRLPADDVGGRVATVHALVRVGRIDDRFTYAPILIKNHEFTETSTTRTMLQGSLAAPWPSHAVSVSGFAPRATATVTRTGVALAHATRVLESLGHGDDRARVGLVDRQRQLWWWSSLDPQLKKFNLRAYDALYETRRDALRAHGEWLRDGGPFPTEPYWHRECLDCPFAVHCESALSERDDVSLVRFTSQDQQALLKRHGVATRADLARLNPVRARVARGRADASVAPDDSLEMTLATSFDRLDELIYRARAHRAGTPLRAVAAQEMAIAVADVEVDVDMESYEDATYLWGAVVTCKTPVAGVREGYHAFVEWGPLTLEREARNFARFWRWLTELQSHARAADKTFAAYCFWANAEDGAMNRAVSADLDDGPTLADLEAFRSASPACWIDVHDVVKRRVQTEGPLGLKALASAAGFTWRDENPSGEASILWYEVAVGADAEAAARSRQRLLDYNEDDCRATRALRDWLNNGARDLPHRDDVGWST
jgi:hypothetical protein